MDGPVQIPVRDKHNVHSGKSHTRRHAGNGTKKKQVQPAPLKGVREAAQAATAANQVVLWLRKGRKRTFVRHDQLEAALEQERNGIGVQH